LYACSEVSGYDLVRAKALAKPGNLTSLLSRQVAGINQIPQHGERKMQGPGSILKSMSLALLAFLPTLAAAQYTVVVGGLSSPRGLTFGPNGALYVAQAGSGGNTGKITRIDNPYSADPTASDLLTGLPTFNEGAGQFVGVSGISALGSGNIYSIMGVSSHEGPAPLGHLLKVSQGGQVRDVADVGDFDYAWSIDHHDLAPNDFPDSNPYGVLALPGKIYIANAATNTLDVVYPNGSEEILAYIPNSTFTDSTPTCVAQGPDGALYLGTLAFRDSFAPHPLSAKVYRVDPTAANPDDLNRVLTLATEWASGLGPINGCAFGPDGSFYASEYFTSGAPPHLAGGDVVKIPFNNPAQHISLTGKTLTLPGGVAVGPDGTVFVSNGATALSTGQVVRLTNH
jgi:glucose/arabinose dehydrogenase